MRYYEETKISIKSSQFLFAIPAIVGKQKFTKVMVGKNTATPFQSIAMVSHWLSHWLYHRRIFGRSRLCHHLLVTHWLTHWLSHWLPH